MNKINNINNTNHIYKSKNFSLMINFNENSKINYLEINIKLTWKNNIYLLLWSRFIAKLIKNLNVYKKIYKILKLI